MILGFIIAVLSLILFLIGILYIITSTKKRMMVFILFSVSAVFALQISFNVAFPFDYGSIGATDILTGEPLPYEPVGWAVCIVRVISHSFQFFSLDADYVELVTVCQSAFANSLMWLPVALVIVYAVIAPATAAFAILATIISIIPGLRLFFNLSFTKYVFSELNERSIELAESIVQKKKDLKTNRNKRLLYGADKWKELKSSVIVFTDVYTDKEAEESSELLERAKQIGAICLRRDVLSLRIHWLFRRVKSRKIVYVLMDTDESINISSAVSLLTDKNTHWKRTLQSSSECKTKKFKTDRADFYVFSRDEETATVVERTLSQFNNEDNGTDHSYDEVSVRAINEYKNLVYRLIDGNPDVKETANDKGFVSYPLYHALLSKTEKGKLASSADKLSIVILGGGRIGTEFLKAAYWCGQILAPSAYLPESRTGKVKSDIFPMLNLNITVLDANADALEKQMRFEMPDAFRLEDEHKNKNLQPYYCNFKFIKTTYPAIDTFSVEGNADKPFKEYFHEYCETADYVLVAFGDDNLNFKAAKWVARYLDTVNLLNPKEIPVNYVIEKSGLCDTLSHNVHQSECKFGCILNPIGALSQQNNYDNVFIGDLAYNAHLLDREAHGNKDTFQKFVSNQYNFNSSVASSIHLQYKRVSINGEFDVKRYREQLYWIEHRRWCAYMYTLGYRCPTAAEFVNYSLKIGDDGKSLVKTDTGYKNDILKMHPCLLESAKSILSIEEIMRSWGANNDFDRELKKKELSEKIIQFKKSPTDISLDDWLKTIYIENKKIDSLDKLSILGCIYFKKDGANDLNYKQYDIEMVNYLNIEILIEEIRRLFNEGSASDNIAHIKDCLAELFDAFSELKKSDNRYLDGGLCQFITIEGYARKSYLSAVRMRQNDYGNINIDQKLLHKIKARDLNLGQYSYLVAELQQNEALEFEDKNKILKTIEIKKIAE